MLYVFIGTLAGGLIAALISNWLVRTSRGEAVHLAETSMKSLWRERDEHKAQLASLNELVDSMRAEALAERQDLYRRIQAPETGGYVMTQVGSVEGGEPALHETEAQEIERQQAIERIQYESAGLLGDPDLAR